MKTIKNNAAVRRLVALAIALVTVFMLASCEVPDISGYLDGFIRVPGPNDKLPETDLEQGDGSEDDTPDNGKEPEVVPCEHEKSEEYKLECVLGTWFYASECVNCAEPMYDEVSVISVSDKWLYNENAHWNNLKCEETVEVEESEDIPDDDTAADGSDITDDKNDEGLNDGEDGAVDGGVTADPASDTENVISKIVSYDVNLAEHNYGEDGYCEGCGYNPNVSVGLEYELTEDGEGYIVVGRGTCTDEHINIPSEYEGKPVVAIGDNAFADIIAEDEEGDVTEGGGEDPAPKLRKTSGDGDLRVYGVTIPDTVVSISCTAFSACSELLNFIVDIENEVYLSTGNCLIDTVLKTVVRGCEFSVIPEDGQVTAIGSYAFAGAEGLVAITIPESIEDIGDKAFMECDALVEVVMPENINIGVDVFRGSVHVEIKVEHTLVLVPAKEATCEEAGNIEYYICSDCGYFYADENGEERLYEVTITPSHEFVDGACTKCSMVESSMLIVSIDQIPNLGKFPLGTLENAIGLPASVIAHTADGKSHELAVAWDLSGYDKSLAGEYTIKGILQSGNFHYAEGLTNQLEAYIEIVEFMKGTADIVFVLDISGSMGEEIAHVKDNIVKFAEAIEKMGVSARWSAITYSDFAACPNDPNEVTQVIKNGAADWYISAEEYKSAIESINLAFGGDNPETAVDGLLCANTLSTRQDARTFYILLTDDTYKNDNIYGVEDMAETITILMDDGVNVSVITTNGYMSIYDELVDSTGGVMCNIYDDFSQQLIDSLVPIIYGEVIA